MKKFILLIFSVILISFPNKLKGIEIDSFTIESPDKVVVGKSFTVTFNMTISGFNKNDLNADGMILAGHIIDYDADILNLFDVSSDKLWDTELYIENNEKIILSVANENGLYKDTCKNNLYCGNYSVKASFVVRDTDASSVTITYSNPAIGLLNIEKILSASNDEDLFDKIEEITKDVSYSKTISVEKYSTNEIEDKEELTPKPPLESLDIPSIPSTNEEDTTPTTPVTPSEPKKSYNNYLSSLTITGYNIDFNKYKNKYYLNLPNDINSLEINLTLEDAKSTYEIIGNNDIKGNNNEITINVTAEDGTINTYKIKALYKNKITNDTTKKTNYKINKKYIIIASSILASFIFICILISIISYIKNKKLYKNLDEMLK